MNREYPSAPLPAVGAVVLKGDRVLLVLRGREPSKGKWSIPGGVMELGESIREAAQREVREECGLHVEPGNVVEVRDAVVRDEGGRIRYHYVLIDVVASYLEGELTVGSDADDARWVSEEELSTYDVTTGLRPLLERCLHRRNLDFPEYTG